MNEISIINDGWILIEDDVIVDFGNMETWKGVDDWNKTNIIDANMGLYYQHGVIATLILFMLAQK